MNRKFVNEILKLKSLAQIERKLEQRRMEILTAIGERTMEPTPEILLELTELNVALGDVDVPTEGGQPNG